MKPITDNLRPTSYTLMLLIVFVLASSVILPVFALASEHETEPFEGQGLVSCTGTDCDFNDLIVTAQRVITWVLYAAVFLAAGLFSWAGILYITAAGDEGQVKKAHAIFRSVLIGFIIALTAWLIVYTITSALLDDKAGIETFLKK